MTLVLLFAEFFKTGLLAVGGGLATLPFLYEMAGTYPWFDRDLIPDMLAVAQSLPGGIGVNLAVYAGFRCAGAAGAVVAGAGLVTPSIIVILVIARTLGAFKENPVVQAVFRGLRPAAAGLLCAAFLLALRGSLWNPGAETWRGYLRLPECALFLVLFLATRKIKLHPACWIAAAGIAGIALGL